MIGAGEAYGIKGFGGQDFGSFLGKEKSFCKNEVKNADFWLLSA